LFAYLAFSFPLLWVVLAMHHLCKNGLNKTNDKRRPLYAHPVILSGARRCIVVYQQHSRECVAVVYGTGIVRPLINDAADVINQLLGTALILQRRLCPTRVVYTHEQVR
jgi:hypothetical protein